MFEIALAILLVAVTGALVVMRRRPSRTPSLASRIEPLPAGVKHLAATVSDLSDFQLHLPAATRALAPRRRLGMLLGLR